MFVVIVAAFCCLSHHLFILTMAEFQPLQCSFQQYAYWWLDILLMCWWKDAIDRQETSVLISEIVSFYLLFIKAIIWLQSVKVATNLRLHYWVVFDDCKSATLYLLFGFGLSPILMTLTETISTDTIYAMTTFMLLANVIFHDYGANAALWVALSSRKLFKSYRIITIENRSTLLHFRVSQSLSLNAAIFAAVCLASRLASVYDAFVTLMWAVLVFAMWPQFRQRVKVCTQTNISNNSEKVIVQIQ